MYTLTTAEAVMYVRKNLDEQAENYSGLMLDRDSTDLDKIIEKSLPEAINSVHLVAPIQDLAGISLESDEVQGNISIDAGVMTLKLPINLMRLVRFRVSDNGAMSLTEFFDDSSPEGRMQKNPYTRASWRNPKLIRECVKDKDGKMVFRYYSLRESYQNPDEALNMFRYIPYQRYEEGKSSYQVEESCLDQAINRLTAIVLSIYGMNAGTFSGGGEQ